MILRHSNGKGLIRVFSVNAGNSEVLYGISAGECFQHAGDFLFRNIAVYDFGLSGLMDLNHGFGPAHAVTPDLDQIGFNLLLLDAVLKSVVGQVSTLCKAAGGCSDR